MIDVFVDIRSVGKRSTFKVVAISLTGGYLPRKGTTEYHMAPSISDARTPASINAQTRNISIQGSKQSIEHSRFFSYHSVGDSYQKPSRPNAHLIQKTQYIKYEEPRLNHNLYFVKRRRNT